MENLQVHNFSGFKIESYDGIKGPCAKFSKLLTAGKNKGEYKTFENFRFATEDRRAAWIALKIENINAKIAYKVDQKIKGAAAVSSHPFKVGSLLYQSWGYDQTNIDFFEVVGVLPKSVKIRPISQKMVPGSGGFMCENVTPAAGEFTGPATVKPIKAWVCSDGAPGFAVPNGRHSLSLYSRGEIGIYQSHYA